MKRYYAFKDNTRFYCASPEKVVEFIAANPGYEPGECHEWNSDELRMYSASLKFISSETGLEYPLETAINRNWKLIMRAAGMFGISGYNVERVRIQRQGSKCIITINGWNCSECLVGFDPQRDWSEEKMMSLTVTFDGVEDGDLHADDFMVDPAKN